MPVYNPFKCCGGGLRHIPLACMQAASAAWFGKEEGLRREVAQLEDRCHALENEKADLAASASESTRPLVR